MSYPLANVSPVDIRADIRYAIEDNNQRKLQGYQMAWQIEERKRQIADDQWRKGLILKQMDLASQKIQDELKRSKAFAKAAADQMKSQFDVTIDPNLSQDAAEKMLDTYVSEYQRRRTDAARVKAEAGAKAKEKPKLLDAADILKAQDVRKGLTPAGNAILARHPKVASPTSATTTADLEAFKADLNSRSLLPSVRANIVDYVDAKWNNAGAPGVASQLTTPAWQQRDQIRLIDWDVDAVGKNRDKLVKKYIDEHRASVAIDEAAIARDLPLVQSILNKPPANRDSSDQAIINDYLDRKAHADNSDQWEQDFRDANLSDISMPPQPKGAGAKPFYAQAPAVWAAKQIAGKSEGSLGVKPRPRKPAKEQLPVYDEATGTLRTPSGDEWGEAGANKERFARVWAPTGDAAFDRLNSDMRKRNALVQFLDARNDEKRSEVLTSLPAEEQLWVLGEARKRLGQAR